MSILELIASQYKQLKEPAEFILSVISERCRAEYLELVEGKRADLSRECMDEVVGAAHLYAVGVYWVFRPLTAVASAYKLVHGLFAEERVK